MYKPGLRCGTHIGCGNSAACRKHIKGVCSTALVRFLQDAARSGKEVDMEACFSQLTLDVIGKAVFNYDFNALNTDSPLIQVPRVLQTLSLGCQSARCFAAGDICFVTCQQLSRRLCRFRTCLHCAGGIHSVEGDRVTGDRPAATVEGAVHQLAANARLRVYATMPCMHHGASSCIAVRCAATHCGRCRCWRRSYRGSARRLKQWSSFGEPQRS
jgi:hypothetical protein